MCFGICSFFEQYAVPCANEKSLIRMPCEYDLYSGTDSD